MNLPSTLSRSRVLKVSKLLRAQGLKLPKMGWCVTVRAEKPGGMSYRGQYRVEVCHDRNGYFASPGDTDGLFGARRRKRR